MSSKLIPAIYGKPFEALVGQIIQAVSTDEYFHGIEFCLADGRYLGYSVEGECCSCSYFHDFINLSAILDKTVISIQELPLDDIHPSKIIDFEHINFYGFRFCTKEANAVLSFRNESNGYYGGRLTGFFTERYTASPGYKPLELVHGSWVNGF